MLGMHITERGAGVGGGAWEWVVGEPRLKKRSEKGTNAGPAGWDHVGMASSTAGNSLIGSYRARDATATLNMCLKWEARFDRLLIDCTAEAAQVGLPLWSVSNQLLPPLI